MQTVKAYAAAGATSLLAPTTIPRREPGPRDVEIDIQFCGVCHSDLHYTHNEWADALAAVYPCVPGHEIVGRVSRVGAEVTGHRPGDLVAVGCLVGSDLTCEHCRMHRENDCPNQLMTYGSVDPQGTAPITYGGYSSRIVVHEHFALRVPSGLDPAATAPLLCAGITTYSPLKRQQVGPGRKVGVVGIGGLGHMGVKLARALGAHVVALTTSPAKKEAALQLGAHEVIVTKNANELKAHAGSFHMILDTVSADHDVLSLLHLLRPAGNLTLVGAPPKPFPVTSFALIMGAKSLSGSNIGGIAETQEMLDFCAQHTIAADVEVTPVQAVNEAWARLAKGDVKYRFSLDMRSI